MGAVLFYAAGHWDWTALRATPWVRIGVMAAVLTASAVVYFASLRGLGMDLRALWRR
jgi:putative peptidoglycan lipid II flippase